VTQRIYGAPRGNVISLMSSAADDRWRQWPLYKARLMIISVTAGAVCRVLDSVTDVDNVCPRLARNGTVVSRFTRPHTESPVSSGDQCVCHSRPSPSTFTPAPIALPHNPVLFTLRVPVLVIPVYSGILPVTERHDVESGAVSRPVGATCKDIAAFR